MTRTCAECRRAYAVALDERRLRGAAADTLCPRCQIAAAHDSWRDATLPLPDRAA